MRSIARWVRPATRKLLGCPPGLVGLVIFRDVHGPARRHHHRLDPLRKGTHQTDKLIHGLYREGVRRSPTRRFPRRPDERRARRQFEAALVNPANRRKLRVIIVGSGLGGAAAASLGETGLQRRLLLLTRTPPAVYPSPRRVVSTPRTTVTTTTRLRLFYDIGQGRRLPSARQRSIASPR